MPHEGVANEDEAPKHEEIEKVRARLRKRTGKDSHTRLEVQELQDTQDHEEDAASKRVKSTRSE